MNKKWNFKKRRELCGHTLAFLFIVAFAISTMISISMASPYSIRIQQGDNVGQTVSNVIITGPNSNNISGRSLYAS